MKFNFIITLLATSTFALGCFAQDSVNGLNQFEKAINYLENSEHKKALKEFLLSADEGNIKAKYNIGVFYHNGYGVQQDYQKAMQWYRLAADQGLARAKHEIGNLFHAGLGVPQNYNEAMKWYRLAAEQEEIGSQFFLGYMYHYGDGVPQNYNEAMKWYRLAANQGLPMAQTAVGNLYLAGLGVKPDEKEAINWYLQAADQGDAEAQYLIGTMYSLGEYVATDHSKAIDWFKRSAESNYSQAQAAIGLYYKNGYGVEIDTKEALTWLSRAAAQGDDYAYSQIGDIYLSGKYVPKDYSKAHENFELAISIGEEPFALNHLGYIYKIGLGQDVDYERSQSYFQRAIKAFPEHPTATFHLAEMYLKGLGVAPDPIKAIQLFTTSANAGYARAAIKLAEIYEYGIGVKKDFESQKSWLDKASKMPEMFRDEEIILGFTSAKSMANARLKNFKVRDKITKKTNTIRQMALVITAQNYKHFPDLKTPINDGDRIGKILKSKFGFEVSYLVDPKRADITKKLNEMANKMEPTDNLLIYYAGHGLEVQGDGYWITVDSERDDDTNWLSNDYITKKLKQISVKNVLLISDSCFSGTLSRGISLKQQNSYNTTIRDRLTAYQQTKSRVVITSGNLEPVLDGGGGNHSVFARAFIETLNLISEDISATELYTKLSKIVVNDTQSLGFDQLPTIAALTQAGHLGPDYVLYFD